MLPNPRRGLRAAIEAAATVVTFHGNLGVWLAMETHDATICGQDRWGRQIERKCGNTMPLETAHPLGGPPLAVIAHRVSQKGLLGAELRAIQSPWPLLFELVENIPGLAGFEAEHRRVANVRRRPEQRFMPREPIVDDAIAPRFVIKKHIERTRDHLVNIQKQRGAPIVAEVVRRDRQLGPESHPQTFRHAFGQVEGHRLHAGVQALRFFRHTDEAKRALQMFFHARIKTIYIKCRVERAPLQANDVNRFDTRHGLAACSRPLHRQAETETARHPEIGAANPGVATKRGGASVCSHT